MLSQSSCFRPLSSGPNRLRSARAACCQQHVQDDSRSTAQRNNSKQPCSCMLQDQRPSMDAPKNADTRVPTWQCQYSGLTAVLSCDEWPCTAQQNLLMAAKISMQHKWMRNSHTQNMQRFNESVLCVLRCSESTSSVESTAEAAYDSICQVKGCICTSSCA
jgi:hypothetical protein